MATPRPSYEVHAVLSVDPFPGFTVEGWLKLHNFKSRKVRRLGKDKESGLQLVEVILSPMVNASIKDVLTPYREAYKWREMADVQPISYYRQEVML